MTWCPECGAVQDMHARYSPGRWQSPNNPRARGHVGGVGDYYFILEPVGPGVGRVVARGDCVGGRAQFGDLAYYRDGDQAEAGQGQIAIPLSGLLRWETPDEPSFRWGLLERHGTWHAWVSRGGVEQTVDLGLTEIAAIQVSEAKTSGVHVFNFCIEDGVVATITFDDEDA